MVHHESRNLKQPTFLNHGRQPEDLMIPYFRYLGRAFVEQNFFMRAKKMSNPKIPGETIACLISESAVNLTDQC